MILSGDRDKTGRQDRDVSGAGESRQEREARALRANLARRKTQQRQRRDAGKTGAATDEPNPGSTPGTD